MNRFTVPVFISVLAIVLASCAGSSHPQVLTPNEPAPAPRFVDFYSEMKVGTLHFPAGVYRLHSTDKIGYYYRTPRGVIQRTLAGPLLRDGGIFVSKRTPTKLRGYVIVAGSVSHVGNLSKKRHRFHN